MRSRPNRSRCYVCREVCPWMMGKIVQANRTAGWHTVVPLCQPCLRAIVQVVVEMAREYR